MKKSNLKIAPKPELKKLDIACGQNKQPGYIGLDFCQAEGVDVVCDLEKFPWPFDDNSVEVAFCSHYIEHTVDLIAFMDEVHRLLIVGGQFTVIAPYYSSVRATQDPTHKRSISEMTFLYFNKAWREQNKLNHGYLGKCDFDFTYGYAFTPEWAMRNEEARNFALSHYINVVNDIHVTLTKRPA